VVNESISAIYVLGGALNGLNGTVPSGSLYSSAPIYVQLPDKQEVEVEEQLLVDDISPKVYGWTTEEEEPNNTEKRPEGTTSHNCSLSSLCPPWIQDISARRAGPTA
jgi:hypothetical protein